MNAGVPKSPMNCSFPNFGKIVKFAFDATGLLPRKRGDCDGLSEQEKKRIQKQLERLIDEEGALLERCGELIQSLAYISAGTINHPKVNLAIGDVAIDLFEVYHLVIRSDGTYLSEMENIRWFCRSYAIQRLGLSIQKHLLRYNLAKEGLETPVDPDWYLPTMAEGTTVWPLEKAIRWIYQVCETNQTRFHFPEKDAKVATVRCSEQQQNLENAADWLNGKRIPSWPALHWNFSTSLERLGTVADPRFRREVPSKRRESMMIVLFLARVATYVCKAISDAFGQAFLAQLIGQFQRQRAWLISDLEPFNKYIKSYLSKIHTTADTCDEVWWVKSEQHWSWFANREIAISKELNQLLSQNDLATLPEGTVSALVAKHGDYSVRTILEQIEAHSEFIMPEGFPQAVLEGMDLKSRQSLKDGDIDRYVDAITHRGLTHCLPWMEPWLRACIRYRCQDYESAFGYMELAFEQAKYCAGNRQYELVNQFIELAAKTDRWKCFKKGVDWAHYLGLSVRWLRDREPTVENLRGTFEMMKTMQYRM